MSSSEEGWQSESSGGEEEEETEMRKMVQAHNRKKKKSGGFQAMGLSHAVFKAITRKGYKIPTPIQRKTIPIIMDGNDVVAMARTGSGKTAAFLVPMLENLKMHSTQGARALILSPTRELALQTLKFTKELGKFMDLKAAVILGGDKMENQFLAMHETPDIIIATPGRLLHVLVEMNKNLGQIKYVVFDEADRLFEMGFAEQLKEIMQRVPSERQTLLFSATMPKTLVAFAKAGLKTPSLVRLDVETKLSAQLKTSFLFCRDDGKEAVLLYLLRHVISEDELTVIFAATKHHVEYLQMLLTKCGISCTYIYSSLDQTARKINVAKFRTKQVKVMLVTDLAARGIDIPHLDNVINFHFPAKAKLFVHRVGRVARAGRSGTAYSLVAMDEVAHLVDLHVFLGRPLKAVPQASEVVEDEDGYFGNIPETALDNQVDELRVANSESSDLQSMTRVCQNAYRQYLRSRPTAASESSKRAKEIEKEKPSLGYHPLFNKQVDKAEEFKKRLSSVIRSHRGGVTIFDINATAKKSSHVMMRAKRAAHNAIIEKTQKNRTTGLSFLSSPSPGLSQPVDEVDEDLMEVFQQTSDQKDVEQRKKKKTKRRTAKDEENYVPYRSAGNDTDKGYEIDGFMSDLQKSVLDFTGDDETNMRNNNTRKWDRKRKRFVMDTDQEKVKKVKTESGNWIPASYKSKLYKTWARNQRIDTDIEGTALSVPQNEAKQKTKGMQVSGTTNRYRHTKGMENANGQPVAGSNKRKFKGDRVKSGEKILKERRNKAKVQAFQKSRRDLHEKRRKNKNKKSGKK